MLHRFWRLLRHRWHADAGRAIPAAGLARITQQVQASEARHSGEIRVCIEAALPSGALLGRGTLPDLVRARAVAVFSDLRVWDTALNNGVLIYLLLAERAIELVADRGIHERVTPQQWQAVVQHLGSALRDGRTESGLVQAIDEVGALLEAHFPLQSGEANPNELPDIPTLR